MESRPPLPPVPVPLRPMTVGEILDGGFRVLKTRPRDVLTVTAAFVIPLQVVLAYLQRGLLDSEALADLFANPTVAGQTSSVNGTLASIVSLVGGGMVTVWTAGALGHLISAWYRGIDVAPPEAIRAALRHTGPLFVAWVAVHLMEGVGLLLLVLPALIVMAVWLVTAPAIVIERIGPFAGMGRSARLTGKRFGSTLAVGVLSGLVAGVVGQILGLLPLVLALVIGGDAWWPLLALGGVFSAMVTTPFVAAATVLAYLDLRIRNEGLDLQVRIDESASA